MNTVKVAISGMSCRACEQRVAKSLTQLPGVVSADVSAALGRAILQVESEPSRASIDAAVRAAGYEPTSSPWVSHDSRAWLTAGATAVVMVGVLFVISRAGLLSLAPKSNGSGGLAIAVLVGLAAGVSTCMALVGGLVLAISASYAATHTDRVATWEDRIWPQLTFQGGRVLGFATGGAILGWLGSALPMPAMLLAMGVLVAAVVMAVLGLRLTGLSPRLAGWSPTLPGSWGARLTGNGAGGYSDSRAMTAGALTFLLPCGFTQAMQIYAVSTGSPLRAAAIMMLFSIGTMPGLLGLGIAAGLGGSRFGAAALRTIGVVVLAFAAMNATGALRTMGIEFPFSHPAVSATLSSNVTIKDGVEIVTMTQATRGYTPAEITVYSGMPISWQIDATDGYSCSSALRVPALGISKNMTTGLNTIDVPALKNGRIEFTCVMGMYTGHLNAIPKPATSTS